MIREVPWPSGFMRPDIRHDLADCLRSFPTDAVANFITEVDGFCFFYARTTTTPSRDDHRKYLMGLHTRIMNLQDELRAARPAEQHGYADSRFDDQAVERAKVNDAYVTAKYEAIMALGKVSDILKDSFLPAWRADNGRFTYLHDTDRYKRGKGGRPRADSSDSFVLLVADVAMAFRVILGSAPTTSRTGAFYRSVQVIARAVGHDSDAPDRAIKPALKLEATKPPNSK